MSTWELTPTEYERTADKIEAINRRAARRGFTGRIDLTAHTTIRYEHDECTGESREQVYIQASITGEAPCYGGWTFLAAVDALPAADNWDENVFVLRYAPGAEETAGDREHLHAGWCDHCRTRNGNRRYTYLVRNTDTGELKQVGSTCIRDFTGWNGNPVFLSLREVEDKLDDITSSGGCAGETPANVIAAAYAAVQEFGWRPAYYHSNTTRDAVTAYYYGRSRADGELRTAMRPHMDTGREQAPVIIDTLRQELTGTPGYEANLLAALSAAYVEPGQFGILVSAVSAYDRLMGRKAREAAQPDRSQVTHQGTVGEKITVTGTITRCQLVDGFRGGVSLFIIIENTTTVVKTVTTAAWAMDDHEMDTGTEVTVTGTVKAHTDYRGTPQTVLTRTKRTA